MEILQMRLLQQRKPAGDVLPKGYKRIAGIKSVNGAYINTCQAGNNFPSFKMSAMLLDDTPLGAYADLEQNAIWGNNGNLRLCIYRYAYFQHGGYSANLVVTSYLNKWVDIEGGYGYFNFDDVEKTFTKQNKGYTADSINLFKARTAQEGRPLIVGVYVSYEGEENPVMVRNMVACERESDGVVGLYDMCGSICPLTNSPFYTNSGTGEFVKVEE